MNKTSNNKINYPFIIRPLSDAEGGGYMIKYPDLPGCISDGESVEEAINMGHEAVKAWISTAKNMGRTIPLPSAENTYSGKFVQRIPKSLHEELAERAEKENVSLNTLVLSYISKCLGDHVNTNNLTKH
jgi:antitoxin HicB